jgi:hypothetical protein
MHFHLHGMLLPLILRTTFCLLYWQYHCPYCTLTLNSSKYCTIGQHTHVCTMDATIRYNDVATLVGVSILSLKPGSNFE